MWLVKRFTCDFQIEASSVNIEVHVHFLYEAHSRLIQNVPH